MFMIYFFSSSLWMFAFPARLKALAWSSTLFSVPSKGVLKIHTFFLALMVASLYVSDVQQVLLEISVSWTWTSAAQSLASMAASAKILSMGTSATADPVSFLLDFHLCKSHNPARILRRVQPLSPNYYVGVCEPSVRSWSKSMWKSTIDIHFWVLKRIG